MRFIWAKQNLSHLASHGVTPEIAEVLFHAEDRLAAPSPQGHGRTVLEASHSGQVFRLVFTRVGPDEIFVIRGRGKITLTPWVIQLRPLMPKWDAIVQLILTQWLSRSFPLKTVEALVSAQPAQRVRLLKRSTSAQTGGYGFDSKPDLSALGP